LRVISGLHPTEVYPSVGNVEGIAPALYHYGVAGHVLEPMERLTHEERSRFSSLRPG